MIKELLPIKHGPWGRGMRYMLVMGYINHLQKQDPNKLGSTAKWDAAVEGARLQGCVPAGSQEIYPAPVWAHLSLL